MIRLTSIIILFFVFNNCEFSTETRLKKKLDVEYLYNKSLDERYQDSSFILCYDLSLFKSYELSSLSDLLGMKNRMSGSVNERRILQSEYFRIRNTRINAARSFINTRYGIDSSKVISMSVDKNNKAEISVNSITKSELFIIYEDSLISKIYSPEIVKLIY